MKNRFTKEDKTLLILAALLIFLAVVLIGCGDDAATYTNPPTNCSVTQSDDGALIECPDGTQVFVPNGQDGSDGQDAESTNTQIIDPCGDYPGHDDEVLIATSFGILAFNPGKKGFIFMLEPGVYKTRDKQKCNFEVTPDLDIIW